LNLSEKFKFVFFVKKTLKWWGFSAISKGTGMVEFEIRVEKFKKKGCDSTYIVGRTFGKK